MRVTWPLVLAVFIAATFGWASVGWFWSKEETLKQGPVRLSAEQKEEFTEIIRYIGLPCAQIVESHKRELKTYYIECELKSDSLARRGYYLDLATRKAR